MRTILCSQWFLNYPAPGISMQIFCLGAFLHQNMLLVCPFGPPPVLRAARLLSPRLASLFWSCPTWPDPAIKLVNCIRVSGGDPEGPEGVLCCCMSAASLLTTNMYLAVTSRRLILCYGRQVISTGILVETENLR